jgi:hypothetical protein
MGPPITTEATVSYKAVISNPQNIPPNPDLYITFFFALYRGEQGIGFPILEQQNSVGTYPVNGIFIPSASGEYEICFAVDNPYWVSATISGEWAPNYQLILVPSGPFSVVKDQITTIVLHCYVESTIIP